MRRVRATGMVVALAAVATAGTRAALAPRAEVHALQGPARASVMHAFAADEPARRVIAIRAFPGDRWSQGDAFHGRETEIVRDQTARNHVALESVLDVLDEDLHARRVPGRHGDTPPCKPRPQYD